MGHVQVACYLSRILEFAEDGRLFVRICGVDCFDGFVYNVHSSVGARLQGTSGFGHAGLADGGKVARDGWHSRY